MWRRISEYPSPQLRLGEIPNKHEKPPNKHFVNGALIDII